MMTLHKQTGYTDVQVMPALIGAILLFVLLGQVGSLDLTETATLVKFCLFLLLVTAPLLFGFAMHLDALGYPESPFNKHSSPLFMTLLCAGPLGYGAYRFYTADLLIGFVVYAVLSVGVIAAGIGFAIYRSKELPGTDND